MKIENSRVSLKLPRKCISMQKKNNVEQNNAVLRQPTTQESGAEAAPEDESKLESEYLSASDDTQQQLNAVIQREEVA